MIIQNITLSALSDIEASHWAFSDDSRFIFLSRPVQEILVYDNRFNNYVTLKADKSVVEYLRQIKGFNGFTSTLNLPYIHVINETTLVISFDNHAFEYYDNGFSALIILIHLDFSSQTFSIIDKLIFTNCFYACLLKDGSQYILLHISEVDVPMDEGNEFRGVWLGIDETRITQKRNDPITFDYDYLSLVARPKNLHLHDNKIWFYRDRIRNVPMIGQPRPEWNFVDQLSYFDLNDATPIKEVPIDILNKYGKTYFTGGFLFHFPTSDEYEMLNLHTKSWSYGTSKFVFSFGWFKKLQGEYCFSSELKNSTLLKFTTQRSVHGVHYIDCEFNVITIDKILKKLYLIPLNNPQKLYDIAWITALNAGLINQKDSPKLIKNLKYQKLF